jgi:uncharacterized protein YbjT (DUF2867 family)
MVKLEGLHVVTGAFGYTGRWIAHHLLERGAEVRTLTNSIGRDDPFGGKVEVHRYDFNDRKRLVESLKGVSVLYNTYWVRYTVLGEGFAHALAIKNSKKLFLAAKEAGVGKIVHVSVANPHKAPDWAYFRGKVIVEEFLKKTGVPYSIVRPTLLYGHRQDVLVNNIAWLLRHLPFFGMFGDGKYPVQPIYADDVANICIGQGQLSEDMVVDAAGPDTFEYREFLQILSEGMGCRNILIPIPDWLTLMVGQFIGLLLQDIVITEAEIRGLRQGLAASSEEPLGTTSFRDWAKENGENLGRHYRNDIKTRKYVK